MTPATPTCSRCNSLVEPGDIRCPVCYLPTQPGQLPSPNPTPTPVLRCQSCNTALTPITQTTLPPCPFCQGTLTHHTSTTPHEEPSQFLLFTVSPKEAAAAYKYWLSNLSPFRPSNLSSQSRIESIQPVWWVGWAFKAEVLITWTADSDAGTRQAPWAPHSGEIVLHFDDIIVPASKGLSNLECARLTPTYAPGSGVPRENTSHASAPLEHPELPRSLARKRILATIQKLAETKVKNTAIPGTRFRHVQTSIHLRGLTTRRLAFPAYILAYHYHNKLYRTVISGQEASCVTGTAPRSITKILLTTIAVITTLTAATLLWLR
jgi:hypothetical protein